MIGLYKITNTVNGRVYHGSSSDIRRRFAEHKTALRNNIHDNSHLQRAWNKYGEKSFVFTVLGECSTLSLARLLEQMILDYKRLMDFRGYNLSFTTVGRQAGYRMSEETKRKIGNANRGKQASPDTRAKISAASKGRINSEASNIKRRNALKGQTPWTALIAARLARTGSHHSDKSRAQMSATKKGKPWSQARREAQQHKQELKNNISENK